MGSRYPFDVQRQIYRPATYRRMAAIIDDPGAAEPDQTITKNDLRMRLPQMRRDSQNEQFSASDRAFISALVLRVEAWGPN